VPEDLDLIIDGTPVRIRQPDTSEPPYRVLTFAPRAPGVVGR
jgi:hypothetical protein